jgi:hypothetical protein
MNREDIIRMAREAGMELNEYMLYEALAHTAWVCDSGDLEHFAALVAAAEREACAKFVEEKATGYEERAAQPKDVRDINPEVARIAVLACGQLAAAIRARGQA